MHMMNVHFFYFNKLIKNKMTCSSSRWRNPNFAALVIMIPGFLLTMQPAGPKSSVCLIL